MILKLIRKSVALPAVLSAVLAVVTGFAAVTTYTGQAQAQELIPRGLLEQMARSQFTTICQSEAFASCMGFSEAQCLALADTAIEKCLGPLPDKIDPQTLDNAALESCPRGVYADAGHTEDKAGVCFDKAMEQE